MPGNKALSFPTGLLLAGLLVGLSACGLASSGPAPATGSSPGGKPDSVSILIDQPNPTRQKPVVTLSDARMVQQLYATIYALPQMPGNLACTTELGPHYTLTFHQGSKTLVTVIAMRDGCRPVSIAGESHDLQAALQDKTPAVIGIVLALSFLLLLVALHAPLIAAAAVGTNLLATGAAFGIARWIFQDGWLHSLLGFESQGFLDAWGPVFFFAMIFAISMDYTVFLLYSAKEHWHRSGGNAREAADALIVLRGT